MRRLKEYTISYDEVLKACEGAMVCNQSLKTKFQKALPALKAAVRSYRAHADWGELFLLPPFTEDNSNGSERLTKKELTESLYKTYFVRKRTGGFYEALLAAAAEKCPFCGGIGQPSNLDHFMPKSQYAQFAIFPLNLLPSCKDCNMGVKRDTVATSGEQQILHPILDAAHFFEEQWVFARYHPPQNNQESFIDYYIEPPKHWSDIDKKRAHTHFECFNIKNRYQVQSSSALLEIELQITKLKETDCNGDFKTVILQPIIDTYPFVNHWKSVMARGLLEHYKINSEVLESDDRQGIDTY